MEVSDKQASQIHGITNSDSDSDLDGKSDFDEEHELFKPPPLDYELIRDKIVVIPRKQIVNVWEERLLNVQKNREGEGTVTFMTKKKKKKSISKAGDNVGNGGIIANKKVHLEFPVLKKSEKKKKRATQITEDSKQAKIKQFPEVLKKTSKKKSKDKAQNVPCSSNKTTTSLVTVPKTKKKETTISLKVPYDSETLKKVEENLDALKNVWHSGLSDTIIRQEMELLRQRESSAYDLWMKSARIDVKPKTRGQEGEKTIKIKVKTKNKSVGEIPSTDLQKNVNKKEEIPKKIEANSTTGAKKKIKPEKKSKQPEADLLHQYLMTMKIYSEENQHRLQTSYSEENRYPKLLHSEAMNKNQSITNIPKRIKNKKLKEHTEVDTTSAASGKIWESLSLALLESVKDKEVLEKQDQANPMLGTKKKKKKKKKSKPAAELFNQNLVMNSMTTKTDSEEDLNLLKASVSEENWNPKLLDREVMNKGWFFFPDDTRTKIQSITEEIEDKRFNEHTTEVDTISTATVDDKEEILDAQAETNPSLGTKKKNKRKKKSKQPVTELSNQNLMMSSVTTKTYSEENLDLENWNPNLLDREVMNRAWFFFPDDTRTNIQSIQHTEVDATSGKSWESLSSDLLENVEDQEEILEKQAEASPILAAKKKSKTKKKPKPVVELSNQNLMINLEMTKTYSEENLNHLEASYNEENSNPKLQSIADIQEDIQTFNEPTTEVDTASTTTGKAKRERTRKKKPKQLTAEPPLIIDPHYKVGQDIAITNEGNIQREEQRGENSTEVSEWRNTPCKTALNDSDYGTNTLQKPEYVFGEDFKDFIRSIHCDGADVIPKLNDFKYEQLYRAYMAHQKKINAHNPLNGNINRTENVNWCSFENPNTNLNFYFMPMPVTNYWNRNDERFSGARNDISALKMLEEPGGIKTRLEIQENPHRRTFQDSPRATITEIYSPSNVSAEKVNAEFHSPVETNTVKSFEKLCRFMETKPENAYKSNLYTPDNNSYANNINDSCHSGTSTNLMTIHDKNNTTMTSKDFDESFSNFCRIFNDAAGVDLITTTNGQTYREIYRVLYNKRNKDSPVDNKNKKIANSVQNDERLLHGLRNSNSELNAVTRIRPADGAASLEPQYELGSADYRENVISSQGTRNIPKISWRNQIYHENLLKSVENYKGVSNFRSTRHSMVSSEHERSSNGDVYDWTNKESSDAIFRRIYETSYFQNPTIGARQRTGSGEETVSLFLPLLYVIFMSVAGILVVNVIKGIISILYDNIIFVVIFLIILIFKT